MYGKRHVLVAAPSAIIARDVTLSSSPLGLCDACVSHHARVLLRTGLTIIAVCDNETLLYFLSVVVSGGGPL